MNSSETIVDNENLTISVESIPLQQITLGNFVTSNDFLLTSGFVYGVLTTKPTDKDSSFINYILNSICGGSLLGVSTIIVSNAYLPKRLRFILPLLMGIDLIAKLRTGILIPGIDKLKLKFTKTVL